jgi:hypothetical protein
MKMADVWPLRADSIKAQLHHASMYGGVVAEVDEAGEVFVTLGTRGAAHASALMRFSAVSNHLNPPASSCEEQHR